MKNQIIWTMLIIIMMTISMTAHAIVQEKSLVGWWLFDNGSEETGTWDDIALQGAKIEGGQLVVETGKWAHALGYTGPDITELTLATWVSLDNYAATKGSALTLDKVSKDQFRAIVWAERVNNQWMPGSSNFRHTSDFPDAVTEKETGDMLFFAITYKGANNQTEITGYRNGENLGSILREALETWPAGDAEAIWGKRHVNGLAGPGDLNAHIEESRIYNIALTDEEIQDIHKGDLPVESRGKLTTQWGALKSK